MHMDKFFSRSIIASLMLAAAVPAFSQEQEWSGKEMAIVDLSANFIREEHEYEAELGDQALMGTLVEILDRSSYWIKIKTPEPYVGWVNEMGLAMKDGKEVGEWLDAPRYICTAFTSHVYSDPSEDSLPVCDLVLGDILLKTFKGNGKTLKVKGFCAVELPSGKKGFVRSTDLKDLDGWAEERRKLEKDDEDSFRTDIIRTAERFVGVPYMWGGTSTKNTDCSGLTRTVYLANGILLPRNCSQQVKVGEDVPIRNAEGEIDFGKLIPGDLIFWGRAKEGDKPERATHVGIYLGDGKFIHSSQMVRINDSASYTRVPIRARRVVGHVDEKGSGIVSMRRSPYYFNQTR